MGSTTPIQRNPAIVEFSKDHHFALLLVWKVRAGIKNSIAPTRIAEYVLHFFDTDLTHHFTEEETILFSRLPSDSLLRMQAENDHRDIRGLLDEVRKGPVRMDQLDAFASVLERHVRFEERELFHFLQETLSALELSKIASSVQPRNHEPDGAWTDMFWK